MKIYQGVQSDTRWRLPMRHQVMGEERLKHYFKLIIVSKNQCFMNIYN